MRYGGIPHESGAVPLFTTVVVFKDVTLLGTNVFISRCGKVDRKNYLNEEYFARLSTTESCADRIGRTKDHTSQKLENSYDDLCPPRRALGLKFSIFTLSGSILSSTQDFRF